MPAEVILIMGYMASGKSTLSAALEADGWLVLSRDRTGGRVSDLLPAFEAALLAGKRIVLDNTFPTVASRAPFLKLATQHGAPVTCKWMKTSFEDAQVNALNRMWDRHGRLFLTRESLQGNTDPNLFPVIAMFALKRKLNGDRKKGIPPGKPTAAEGFAKIEKVPFVRRPWPGKNKALILDYDGTLRESCRALGFAQHYPTHPDQVQLLPGRKAVLERYRDAGWKLLGVSNQSGVGKGLMTADVARACFERTDALLGVQIETLYCPHSSFPVACYCRKPQAGLGVQLIRKHDLDPAQCIYVGDQSTDRSFAARCGFRFEMAEDFFA